MRPRVALLMLGLLFVSTMPTSALADERDDLDRALAFIASAQNADGGWDRQGPYIVEAAASAGIDVKRWPTPERSAWDGMMLGACPTLRTDTKDCEYKLLLRRVHAAGVAGYDPRQMPGFDGVAAVRAGFVAGQFGDPRFVSDDMFAILALRAAGVPRNDAMIQTAAQNVHDAQREDGGWSENTVGGAPSVDVTGFALAALDAAGQAPASTVAARAFVLGQWRADGRFGNVQNTAWAIHALHVLSIETNASALAWLWKQQGPDGRIGGDYWSTSEAIIPLAGGRFPLPGFAPATVTTPAAHAREPVTLRVSAPFTRVSVTWDDGTTGTRTFSASGSYHYRYLAEGPGVIARGEGDATILSARPVLGAFPPNVTLFRHSPLTLDLRNASDSDGRIIAFEIDWGDGTAVSVANEDPGAPAGASRNVTTNTTHAFTRPGAYEITVRAKDDTGVWSLPGKFRALVENRAPVVTLPTHLVADRTRAVDVVPTASDPEGDELAMRWRIGNTTGDGSPRFMPATLGNQTLRVVVTDAFGAEANASTVVEVVNLPPSLTLALSEGEVVAATSDPDGPPPSLTWTLDGAPAQPPLRPAPGRHTVHAVATDADGASVASTLIFEITSPGAPSSEPIAPVLGGVVATLTKDVLDISWSVEPEDAHMRVIWRSDAGDGETQGRSPLSLPLPGASWATATVIAEHDGIETRRESGLVTPPSGPTPERETTALATPVVVESVAPAPLAPFAEGLEPASLTLQASEKREAPAGPWVLAVVLAAMLGRRARSA